MDVETLRIAKLRIEELKKQFKVANVAGRGRCIIIPLDKFKDEWDQTILDAGLESHANENAVFVHLKDEESQFQSPFPRMNVLRRDMWTEKEDKLLIALWNQKPQLKKKYIAKKLIGIYPQRTSAAVLNRLSRLKKKGEIQSRKKAKATFPPSTAETGEGEVPGQIVDDILRVLEKHSKLLDKLECHLFMHVLKLKQQKGELTVPPSVLVHYANALLEPDIKFRDVFRNKVKQLLEASQ